MSDMPNKLGSTDGNTMPAMRSKVFRNALLANLPLLSAPSWQQSSVTDVHDSIAGLSDLGADTFLEVIARFAEKSHE